MPIHRLMSRKQFKAWRIWLAETTGHHTRQLFAILLALTFVLALIYHLAEVEFVQYLTSEPPERKEYIQVKIGEGPTAEGTVVRERLSAHLKDAGTLEDSGEKVTYLRTLASIFILLLSGFDVDPPKTHVGWATAFMILIVNVLFIGTIIQGIGEIILKSKGRRLSGMANTRFKNHTVIFGLNRHSRAIMKLYLDGKDQYKARLVLVDEMLEQFPTAYAAETEWVDFVKGNPFDEETLKRANLGAAKAAIISPSDDGLPSEADSRAILIALAVERFNEDVVTTLILRDRDSRMFLEKNTDNGKIAVKVDQVICPEEIVECLTANAALNPGLAAFILDVVSYEDEPDKGGDEPGADNIIVVEALPDDLFEDSGWREKEMEFHDLVNRFLKRNGGLVLGLQDEDGQEILPGKVKVGARQVLVLKKE